MVRQYHSLLERIDGQWFVRFGCYSKNVVREEMRDRRYSYPYPRARDMKIVTHPDTVNSREIAALAGVK